ncbi:hypothetical protein [Hymenobacter lucidus]|uniref:Uncharacterized protein n=1 Tax=Hymenobacter lucidus TaxID=2880930 RepID=A0ABS8AWA1_9BACT|nr:hypothetical protein [Hymenobacter lucidus]MCB2409821.1 hypothetical protein [Hymenobacter lucidus]
MLTLRYAALLPLALTTLGVFTSCQDNTAPASVMVSPAAEAAAPAPEIAASYSSVQQLLALYPVYPLPLRLSTTELDENSTSKPTLVQGRPVPEPLLALFGQAVQQSEGNGVFALARLDLPDRKVGLLTRMPGEYASTRIKLLVLDPPSGRILDECEVAETFGDAGDAYIRTSTISRDAKKQLLITIDQQHCSPTDSTMEHITCSDSVLTYQLRDSHFQVMRRRAKP